MADCEAGNVQLTGGPNRFEGRVEVCVNERWAQVCGNGGWGIRTSAAVCNQIIAGGNGKFSSSTACMLYDNLICTILACSVTVGEVS